jgi:CheY-like chemotaxis protein
MRTVVVVDDEEPIRLLVREFLGDVGVKILEASSREGLQNLIPQLLELQEPPVIILDGSFPHFGDGMEMARVLRDEVPGVVIISHSGDVGHEWGDYNVVKGLNSWTTLVQIVKSIVSRSSS